MPKNGRWYLIRHFKSQIYCFIELFTNIILLKMYCLTFTRSVCITTKLQSLEFLMGGAAILQVTLDCYCAETKKNTMGWERS